ncbi:hypothetical protein [Nannocystis sp.]|uniref:hypothetical protein n=1 Tax=Nannocystis sp. TaxID=1962667 RepID=UPI0025DA973E|nr:hypothetical protein [Nannocystis sp.]MBK7825429.1 hypothetical protein [Nannocystis sp.]
MNHKFWSRALLLWVLVLFCVPLTQVFAQAEPPGVEVVAEEKAKAEAEPEKEAEAEPEKEITEHQTVHVGAFLNDIQTIDLKLHSYLVDVYIWFRWKNPDIDPASSFEFTNANDSWGHVRSANWEAPKLLPDGSLYQVVHVQGRFSRKFLLYNYPFDRQTIEVSFEDSVWPSKQLGYVEDAEGFTVNPAMVLPGYRSEAASLEIRDFQYPTKFGDTRALEPESYSRVTLRLPIHRPRGTYAIKLLLPVLCVIACASLMFVLKPTYVDARLSIGITALLTIVALQITLNADMPDVDYLVLMDKIYVGAYLFVIAGLAVVVRTARMVESDQLEAAIRVHRRAMVGLLSLFLLGTLALVVIALSRG